MESKKLCLLAIDDSQSFLATLKAIIGNQYRYLQANTCKIARQQFANNHVDIILMDYDLNDLNEPNCTGLDLCREFVKQNEEVDILMISSQTDLHLIRDSADVGAIDYLPKPFEEEALFFLLEKVKAKKNLKHFSLLYGDQEKLSRKNMLGQSKAFNKLRNQIAQLKGETSDIHICGPTGTGKELVARALYEQELTNGRPRPFVAINCAAIPESLMESLLLGHEKGSFTGAEQTRIGKFELADGGDIFLDEIACLTLPLQAKLLRVLQEREVERVGGNKSIAVNFRLITATNENLQELAEQKKFRTDLLMRIKIITLETPPLAERLEDVGLLADFFVQKYQGPVKKKLSEEAKDFLKKLNYPGNIRELEGIIRRVLPFSRGPFVLPEHITPFLAPINLTVAATQTTQLERALEQTVHPLLQGIKMPMSYEQAVEQFEKNYLSAGLKIYENQNKLGEALDLAKSTLSNKIKKLGLS